jgi:hypothetical protein
MGRHSLKRFLPDDGSGFRSIVLTRGLVALVDHEDYARLGQYNWHAFPGTSPGTFYAVRGAIVDGKYKNVFLHNEVMGVVEVGMVDHVNHDGLDNRRGNLRMCARHENMRNRTKRNGKTSYFKGVSLKRDRGLWEAKIAAGQLRPDGKRKQIHLGYFKSELDAASAYDRAAREHFGAFAVLNGV